MMRSFARLAFLLSLSYTYCATAAAYSYHQLPTDTQRRLALAVATSRSSSSSSSSNSLSTQVTLKIAVDANGGVADLSASASSITQQHQQRFTCDASLDMVHRLRCCTDAVLVGRGTVMADNPSLTIRRVPCARFNTKPNGGCCSLRVILDPQLQLLPNAKEYQILHDGHPTVIYHAVPHAPPSHHDAAVHLVYMAPAPADDNNDSNALSVSAICAHLAQHYDAHHVMVEGGPTTAWSFLQAKAIDRVILVKAPLCFRAPLPSHFTDEMFTMAGLSKLGTIASGVDQLELWSRPNLPWPSEDWSKWP